MPTLWPKNSIGCNFTPSKTKPTLLKLELLSEALVVTSARTNVLGAIDGGWGGTSVILAQDRPENLWAVPHDDDPIVRTSYDAILWPVSPAKAPLVM